MGTAVTGHFEQLTHDLGISLAIEPHPFERGISTDLFTYGGNDGSPSSACGQQDCAVDVEKDEFHRCSSLRTATSLSRRLAARLPGSHDSISTPPQAKVEWIRVSASP